MCGQYPMSWGRLSGNQAAAMPALIGRHESPPSPVSNTAAEETAIAIRSASFGCGKIV